jgi:hypothetical protein
MFDDHNGQRYEIWRNMMKAFIGAHGYDVWYSVVTGYTGSKKLKIVAKKELKINNKIIMDFILEGLSNRIKDKLEQCSSSKELWDKLHILLFKESLSIIEPEHAN